MSSFTFGFNVKPRRAGGVSYDADAQAFFTAASITDTTQKSAVNQLVLDLKSYGVWTKCLAIYPIVGGSASSHAVNLKTPGTYNLTFATGMTHSSTGMVSNGSTGYANTNLNPTSVSLSNTSTHISFYRRNVSASSQVLIGAIDAASFRLILCPDFNYAGYQNITEIIGSLQVNRTQISTLGFINGNRPDSTQFKIHTNNTVAETVGRAATSTINTNIFLCGMNQAGTPLYYTQNQCAFASIGSGLTDTQAANFYTAVQAYQTTLSRNV